LLKHPAAADDEDLAGDVVGGFRAKKEHGGGDVLRSRGAADRIAGVADAAGFAEREMLTCYGDNVRLPQNDLVGSALSADTEAP